jgi:hypothetical protein
MSGFSKKSDLHLAFASCTEANKALFNAGILIVEAKEKSKSQVSF